MPAHRPRTHRMPRDWRSRRRERSTRGRAGSNAYRPNRLRAARVPQGEEWWARPDSNRRQHRYERRVLTAELQAPRKQTGRTLNQSGLSVSLDPTISGVEEAPELPRPARVLQLAQGLGFDLADALAGDRELLADFLQGVVGVHADAEA